MIEGGAAADTGEVRYGDCTKLMPRFPGREAVDLLLTDPPYCIAANLGGEKHPRTGRRERRGFGTRNNCNYEGGCVPFDRWLPRAAATLRPGGVLVVFESPLNIRELARSIERAGLRYTGFGVWNAVGRQSNMNRRPFSHFDVWAWAVKPGARYYFGNVGMTDVLTAPTILGARGDTASKPRVPGAKPVSILRPLIRTFCPPGGLVFDPFLGSGSTGRAAREEGRRWAGCEIGERLRPSIEARSLSAYPPLDSFAEVAA